MTLRREYLGTLSIVTALMLGIIQAENVDFAEMHPIGLQYLIVFLHSLAIYSAINSIMGTVFTYFLSATDDNDSVNILLPSLWAGVTIVSYLFKFALRHAQVSFGAPVNRTDLTIISGELSYSGYVNDTAFFFAYGLPLYGTIVSIPFQVSYFVSHRHRIKRQSEQRANDRIRTRREFGRVVTMART